MGYYAESAELSHIYEAPTRLELEEEPTLNLFVELQKPVNIEYTQLDRAPVEPHEGPTRELTVVQRSVLAHISTALVSMAVGAWVAALVMRVIPA